MHLPVSTLLVERKFLLSENVNKNINAMIMKKDYMHPQAEEVNVVAESILALSTGDGQQGSETPEATNDRRGTWGDVWGK